jgi:2-polyprenyl-3-methyl-5-hydroxy-6-metoxy-1,4-benzoquinol methylase
MSECITCLLCGASGPAEIISRTLRDDSSGRFKVVRCLTCGHVQLFPLPSSEDDRSYYNTDRQTQDLMGETNFELWRNKAAADTNRRVNWLSSVLDARGGVLDIGCGYGFFVDALAQRGYRATGIDVSQARLALAEAYCQGTFIRGEIEDGFLMSHREDFQVVTLFHVLEHVHQPVAFLRLCSELVAPGGWLLVEVPNVKDELLDQQIDYRRFESSA